MNLIIQRLSRNGTRLFKNPCGSFNAAPNGAASRWIHYGLHDGSSDIIGFTTVTVTPEMVGERLAVFVGIEVKTGKGKETVPQKAWGSMLRLFGARTCVARQLEDASAILSAPHIQDDA